MAVRSRYCKYISDSTDELGAPMARPLNLTYRYTYCERLRLATRSLGAGSKKEARQQLATTIRSGTHYSLQYCM